ncbi:DUF3983 domain-containing protein [Ectobacillus ponti]|uniref:DUF3983 domain-containing protein n=1 Tax=Ectobacillus ponti TaxID=2961894 RepID=A0AA41X6H8_9BACI|nr:DUF3983 domain-containing protein [Ectobacillus ponti]MCP8969707.1 DUF3983 domain-containing protein [Ectobacillus ponti]
MAANKEKRKRRLAKTFKRREREIVRAAWRNIFVKAGILKE